MTIDQRELEQFLSTNLQPDEKPQFIGEVIRIGPNLPKTGKKWIPVMLILFFPIWSGLSGNVFLSILIALPMALVLVFVIEFIGMSILTQRNSPKRFLVVTNKRLIGITKDPQTFTEFAPRAALKRIASETHVTQIEFDNELFHCKPIRFM